MVRSALLKGILSDRGAHLHPALHRVEMHRQTYQRVLDAHGLTLAALATKFALSFAEVSAVLLGIDRAAYLEQALAAAGGNPLPPGTVAELRASAYPDPDFLDLPAWDRKGWLR
jgi:aryl-alcohol dehydrogenase-like predicted oxidoreductase